jgi:hypothetical protein
MTSEEVIRKWIEELADGAHAAYYQHILNNGEAFDKIARKRLPQYRHFKMENKTQEEGSYVNSQRFAQAYPGVQYYEGFRFAGLVIQGFPIIANFAWNVVDGDTVVEWVHSKDADMCSPVYFGVEVPVEFLKRYIGKQIALPMSLPKPGSPGLSIPVDLTLGTPLLGWYLRLNEEGMA